MTTVLGSQAADHSATRDQVHTFLTDGMVLMNADTTREILKDPEVGRPGLKLIELQRKIWDELGVNHNNGKRAIDSIEHLYEDPAELVTLRKTFVDTAKKIYLQSLEDRRPSKLETEAKIPRPVILEFFDACSAMMDAEETRASLKAEITETADLPSKSLEAIRWQCLEMLGWEREHGKSCFGTLATDFPKDVELMQGVERWNNKAKGVCMTMLYEFKKAGGEIKGNPAIKMAVLEIESREQLQIMTPEDRGALMEKNMKKVTVFRDLPQEGRVRYLDKLSEDAKLELVKSEMLLISYMQQQEQQKELAQKMAALDPKKQALVQQMMKEQAQARTEEEAKRLFGDPGPKTKVEDQPKTKVEDQPKAKAKGKKKR